MKLSAALIILVLALAPALSHADNSNSQLVSPPAAAGAPLWFDQNGYTADGIKALKILNNTAENGISPDRYHAVALNKFSEQKLTDAKKIAEVNSEVNRSLVLYLLDLHFGIGQSKNMVEKLSADERKQYQAYFQEALTLLVRSPDYNTVLDLFSSKENQYLALKNRLGIYNKIKADKTFRTIAFKGTLKAGQESASIPDLRYDINLINSASRAENLDAAKLASGNTYDNELYKQVVVFQHETGMEENGVINAALIAKLNSAIDTNIEQVAFTMDKIRSDRKDMGSKYVKVNIPEFKLYAYDDGKQQFSMPIIVGKFGKETPEFNNKIQTMVLNPDWHPTAKITKELVARMRRDPSFLAKGGYEVKLAGSNENLSANESMAMDWNNIDSSQVRIRQGSGDQNALGKIKFIMPNSDDIYLHDTNSHGLFKNAMRALSHGCIRLSEPFKLAEFVLGEELFKKKSILKIIGSGTSEAIKTADIPVYSIYHTAWVDDNNQLIIANDVYKKLPNFRLMNKGEKTPSPEILAAISPVPSSNWARINVNEVALMVNPSAP